MKYKVITTKQLNQLENLLNGGWELHQIATYDKDIVYILRNGKK